MTGWSDRPPYQFLGKTKKADGYDVTFIQAVAKHLNCDSEVKKLPWGRQHGEAMAGRFDLLMGGIENPGFSDYFTSDGFRSDPIGFYWKSEKKVQFQGMSLKEMLLDGFIVAYVRYDHRSDEMVELLKKPRFKRQLIRVQNARGLFRNIMNGKVDGGYLHLATAEFFFQKNGRQDLVINRALSFDTPVSFLVAKKSKFGTNFVEEINEAIAALNENGTTKKLENKYLDGYTIDTAQ